MELWQQMIRDSIHTVDQLVEKFNIDRKVAEDLDEFFQARINPYYFSLIRYPGDPIWLQCVPDKAELEDFDADEESGSEHYTPLSRQGSISCYKPMWTLLPILYKKKKSR